MTAKVLIIGASGRIGAKLVAALDANGEGVALRLASSSSQAVEQWRSEGRDGVLLDLNDPTTLTAPLEGVERVFLLTTYTADMLVQSKHLVDAARASGVKHMVHLGVFTSRGDRMPHFIWHDFIERYIEASGMAWTHLHPNVIADSYLAANPPLAETNSFSVPCGDAVQGLVFADDIADVAAAVLREGPDVHAGAEYWMSTELLSGQQVASIISEVTGRTITCHAGSPDDLAQYVSTITNTSVRAYMESAVLTMQLTVAGELGFQTVVRDDVAKVLGRPGMTVAEWARRTL